MGTAITAGTRTSGGSTLYTLAARRDILAGEEVTNDYATSAGVESFTMGCSCGSPLCRHVITGNDWRIPALQLRYGDHWVPGAVRPHSGHESPDVWRRRTSQLIGTLAAREAHPVGDALPPGVTVTTSITKINASFGPIAVPEPASL